MRIPVGVFIGSRFARHSAGLHTETPHARCRADRRARQLAGCANRYGRAYNAGHHCTALFSAFGCGATLSARRLQPVRNYRKHSWQSQLLSACRCVAFAARRRLTIRSSGRLRVSCGKLTATAAAATQALGLPNATPSRFGSSPWVSLPQRPGCRAALRRSGGLPKHWL